MTPTRDELIAYIRSAAIKRGIDPDVAVAVARSEGLNADPAEGWQSKIVKNGVREPSFGPFQLYTEGGLGNEFIETTGLDPRDPSTVYAQIDFSLDKASEVGWTPWYGAKAIGLGAREGLDGSTPVGFTSGKTDEARRRQYALGDADPGTAAEVLEAYRAGDMTKSEAARYVSEDLLDGIEPEEEASFLDRLGEAAKYLDLAGVGQAQRLNTPSRLSTSINPGTNASGASALKRFGIASLV